MTEADKISAPVPKLNLKTIYAMLLLSSHLQNVIQATFTIPSVNVPVRNLHVFCVLAATLTAMPLKHPQSVPLLLLFL